MRWIYLIVLVPTIARAEHPKVQVPVSAVGSSVLLIGRLGQPLGKMMTIQGVWKMNAPVSKDGAIHFHVSHVNENRLEEPVVFHNGHCKLLNETGQPTGPTYESQQQFDGWQCTLRAYETGGIEGSPLEFYKETGGGVPQTMYDGLRFVSKIVGVVKSVKAPQQAPISKVPSKPE